MTARNDITGDTIQTKGASAAYSEGWDRIFNKKKKQEEALDELVRVNEELGLYEEDGKPNPLIKK